MHPEYTWSENLGIRGTENQLGWTGRTVAMVLPIVWLMLFVMGVNIDSGPYREELQTAFAAGSWAGVPRLTLVIGITYVHTNTLLLSQIAGVLGTLGSIARLTSPSDHEDRTNPVISGSLRGFVVYVSLWSSALVLEGNVMNPTSDSYTRIALLTSLTSFVISYYPRLFASVLDRNGTGLDGPSTPGS